jgi:hypothetical protein
MSEADKVRAILMAIRTADFAEFCNNMHWRLIGFVEGSTTMDYEAKVAVFGIAKNAYKYRIAELDGQQPLRLAA